MVRGRWRCGMSRSERSDGMRIRVLALLSLSLAWFGCGRGHREEDPNIVFRSSDGRTLTLDDLKNAAPGKYEYEITEEETVSAEAESLHSRGREAGGRDDYALALTLFTKAAELDPEWPYPVYDRAFIHLLMGDSEAARADYQKTVTLAPRGFFKAISAVDALTKEKGGQFPEGTYLA